MWGGGGAPFTYKDVGKLIDKGKNEVYLMGKCQTIFEELHFNEKWKDSIFAFSSGCDEPNWARECIAKFKINDSTTLGQVVKNIIIDKRNKSQHIIEHCKKLGIKDYKEIIFFDNEIINCKTVAKLGCTAVRCPNGLSQQVWTEALKKFPAVGKVIQL